GVQTATGVQLDPGCRLIAADFIALFYRLLVAVGSVGLLGDHRGHQHRRLRAGSWPEIEVSFPWWTRGRRISPHSLLCVARNRVAAGCLYVNRRPFVAGAQRWRPGAPWRAATQSPGIRSGPGARDQD